MQTLLYGIKENETGWLLSKTYKTKASAKRAVQKINEPCLENKYHMVRLFEEEVAK
jgi:uncharacterized protein YegP (UPF0339 family)